MLSTRDAALACGVQPCTIRQWVKRGKLTRYGSRRAARFELSELAHLVATRHDGV